MTSCSESVLVAYDSLSRDDLFSASLYQNSNWHSSKQIASMRCSVQLVIGNLVQVKL